MHSHAEPALDLKTRALLAYEQERERIHQTRAAYLREEAKRLTESMARALHHVLDVDVLDMVNPDPEIGTARAEIGGVVFVWKRATWHDAHMLHVERECSACGRRVLSRGIHALHQVGEFLDPLHRASDHDCQPRAAAPPTVWTLAPVHDDSETRERITLQVDDGLAHLTLEYEELDDRDSAISLTAALDAERLLKLAHECERLAIILAPPEEAEA
ncbi:MAG TPA: hypothetical protein VFH78_00805 [Candidatus Thermoplasmatota archaeon]|nr:hypothetical protein [Candidatus Thermoplasmatota archaeon]